MSTASVSCHLATMTRTRRARHRVSFMTTTTTLMAALIVTSQCCGAAPVCEPITQPVCIASGVPHRFTKTPIVVTSARHSKGTNHPVARLTTVYQTQREAATAMEIYQPLLARARGCREYLRPLLCTIYLPACPGQDALITPCRDLCERAWRGCSRTMRYLGLAWAPALNCQQFPTSEENPSCISALRLGEVKVDSPKALIAPNVSLTCFYDLSPSVPLEWVTPNGTRVSDNPSEPIYTERIGKNAMRLIIHGFIDSQHEGNYTCRTIDQGFRQATPLTNIFEPATGPSCEPISIPYCQDQLTYSHTSLSRNPSIFSSQSSVEDFLVELLRPIEYCPHIRTLLCSYFLPKCDDNDVYHSILPCREVCDKVISDCLRLFPWMTRMRPAPCDGLSYSSSNVKCYKGVEFGPARFPDGWTLGSISMELECRTRASYLTTAKITLPSGASYSLSHPPHHDGIDRLQVSQVNDNTVKLIVHQFSVKLDSGVYTCSDGAFHQDTVVRDVPTTCTPITVHHCVGQLSYNSTQLPNLYGIGNQREMEDQLRQFDGLLRSGCSSFAGTLLCTPFLSRCGTRSDAREVTMCRDLCDKVKSDCQSVLEAEELEQFSCDMFPYQKDKPCYNGLEVGPVQVSKISGGQRVQVECRHPAVRTVDWLIPGEHSEHIKMRDQDPYTNLLVIDGFQDNDGGVYTCTDGTFSQEVNITTALVSQGGSKTLQLSTETQTSEDGGVVVILECDSSLLPSPVEKQSWLLPKGTELKEGQRAHNVRASMVSGGVARLVITDFQAEKSGNYSCHMDDQSVSVTLDNDIAIHSAEMTPACEEIKNDTCRHLLGYDLTWAHPANLRLDALLRAIGSHRNASASEGNSCSTYLQILTCLHRFPRCAGDAVAEQRLPCREMCIKAETECRDAGAGSNLQLVCHKLPSQANSRCFSGVWISPVKYRTTVIGSTSVEVNCTYPAVTKEASWRSPDGELITNETLSGPISTRLVGEGTIKLSILSFDGARHQGKYTCFLDGLGASVSIKDISKGSCQRIQDEFCSEGVGYSHAYFPNVYGHRTAEEASTWIRLIATSNPDAVMCSPYGRPLLCSRLFLPCDPEAEEPAPLHLKPCHELCLKNRMACREGSNYTPRDCIRTNDGPWPCYDVDEVTISKRVSVSRSGSLSVDCTYNLLPEYQPRWFLPNGQPVHHSDVASNPRVIHVSPSVSRLMIEYFMAYGGAYTCSGPTSSVAVTINTDNV